eukprot:TRINITY_DN7138_c0_g1_i12.p1 TRINITY_DN7138_c0_g1~~TRINITY_DN7138_c0_g1_i12.p1  ORF type:complete len:677 (+),score=221.02 TRINITY_DN7138_c0_g1_i12:41-2071(+)
MQSRNPAAAGGEKKPAANDQVDGEMAQFIRTAAAVYTKGMNVDAMHELVGERQSALLKGFDEFMKAARESALVSSERGEDWKKKGNDSFKRKNYDEAVLCYTRAAHDIKDPTILSVIYTNRATCLHNMELYAYAVTDANKAISLNSEYLKSYYRRGKSLIALGKPEGESDVQYSEGKAPAPTEQSIIDSVIQANRNDERSKPKPPVYSPHIAKEQTPEKGRKIVAKKHLQEGTVVIAEDAFCAVLRNEHLLTHCDWCLQHTPNLYPSQQYRDNTPMRSRGLYCSDACSQYAWDAYGKVEARHPFFLVCPIDVLLSYRAVLCRDERQGIDEPVNQDYMKTLEGHTRETEETLPVGGGETAAAMLGYHAGAVMMLALECGAGTDGLVSVPELWVYAERLKRYMQQIITNGVGITKMLTLNGKQQPGMHSMEQRKVATALFPCISLVNHSCAPNAFINFEGGPHTAFRRANLRVTQYVEAGEEICISYGVHKNKIHSVKNRREALQQQYNFLCHCEACNTETEDPVSEEKQELMVSASTYYQKGRRMMREGRHADAIPAFEASLDILLNKVFIGKHRTSFVVGKTQDALAECHAALRDYKRALNHCQSSLESTIYVHGANEIEVAYEHLKICGLALTCNEVSTAKEHLQKAEKIFSNYYGPEPMPEVEECREAIKHVMS